MKPVWTCPRCPSDLVVVEGSILLTSEQEVIALDASGRERWRRSFARRPRELAPCGPGVAFELAERRAPTQVMALDLEGVERWRYDRRWILGRHGVAGDAHGVVLYGQDLDAEGDRWVGLDPATGACVFDALAPAAEAAQLAGAWLIASLEGGDGGIVRTDRRGGNPTTITPLAHSMLAATDELALLNTRDDDGGPTEMVAFELATGRERWRAPGGNNLGVAICDRRAAWVEGGATGGHPVVRDLATGALIWSGDPLAPIREDDGYRCKLGPRALVCYDGFKNVTYHALETPAPIHRRPWDRDDPDASRFLGDRFLEASFHGVTCLELP
jgi:outer membrane protein assembly factor BamB